MLPRDLNCSRHFATRNLRVFPFKPRKMFPIFVPGKLKQQVFRGQKSHPLTLNAWYIYVHLS